MKPRMFWCLLMLPVSLVAQNEIYCSDGVKEGKVADITPDKVKYKNPQNPGPLYSINRNKVLFLFNNGGSYLMLTGTDTTSTALSRFTDATTPPSTDIIYTVSGDRIAAMITAEDNQTVSYSANNAPAKINHADIVAIVYRSGQHKILATDYTFTAGILKKYEDLQWATAAATTNPNAAGPSPNGPAQPLPSAPVPSNASGKVIAVSNTSPATPAASHSASAIAAYIDAENSITFKDYQQKALEKTNELSGYLRLLCDKSVNYDQANKAIDQACNLFVSENAVVELSTLSQNGIQRFKIRDYFKRLKLLKYSRVDIQWAHIQYVSKLRKAPDGTYRGIITVDQTFTGFIENKVVYSDMTRKNIEVVLKTYSVSEEGKSQTRWDVLLSDIKVIETKNS
jgi:hypothetical protein